MERHNIHYAIAKDNKNKHEFELNNLGDKKAKREIAFSVGRDSSVEKDISSVKVTLADYDKCFRNTIMRLYPPSNVKMFLFYQLKNHVSNEGDVMVFLEHIKYTTFHYLKKTRNTTCYDILNDWINKMEKDILIKHFTEKIAYLTKAYEVAIEYAPDAPYSVSINPVELGINIGLNKASTSRIVHELVSEGLASSTLGMGELYLLPYAAKYLLSLKKAEMEEKEKNTVINNHIQIKDSTNVNFANHSNHVNQQNTFTANDVATAIEDIKKNLDKLQQHLDDTDSFALQDKIETLEAFQETESWESSPVFQKLFKAVGGIIQAIPANVVANILTPYTIELFQNILLNK